jgi:hypothetical protein
MPDDDPSKKIAAKPGGGAVKAEPKKTDSEKSSGTGPSTPKETGPVTRLFNQQDLTGFYTFLGSPGKGAPPIGKGKDPNKVFTVKDGLLRISGQDMGALLTAKEYQNYHLTVEYRWGQKSWPPREKLRRDSGILLHCIGPEDAFRGWMPQSIQCNINEGGVGDLILLPGKTKPPVSLSAETRKIPFQVNNQDRSYFVYAPGEPLTTFSTGYIRRAGNLSDWKDEKGFHRPDDVERPAGEWNVLECICQAGKIVVRLNDKVVNEASNVAPRKGKIGFNSEHAEIFFRTINLRSIDPK